MLERVLTIAVRVFFFPLYLLLRGIEEVSGERRWYTQQVLRMDSERPPLADAEFLGCVRAGEDEGSLWLAVRHAFAESIGLPAEAIYPQDRLAVLWRMQWGIGGDLRDVVLRVERLLGIRIGRRSFERLEHWVHHSREGEFREFASAVVQELRADTGVTA
jgi:hypothetical protein